MIITLLTTVIGVAANLLPGILTYFEKKQELQHELKLLEARLQYDSAKVQWDIDKINVQADANEGADLRRHDSTLDGGRFINALRASVRPVLTYSFFGVFVTIKVLAATTLMNDGVTALDAMDVIWDDNAKAMFGAIVGFWFGGRMIQKWNMQKKLPWKNKP
tara:strand:+ start:12001 stop:12486 length:486 start_codon:yes stop_codon:yes gene_type:complete